MLTNRRLGRDPWTCFPLWSLSSLYRLIIMPRHSVHRWIPALAGLFVLSACSDHASLLPSEAPTALSPDVYLLNLNTGFDDLSPTQVVQFGELLFFDRDLSANRNQACSSCHAPEWGFAGPDQATLQEGGIIGHTFIPGSFRDRFGNRNVPTAAYASFAPPLHWDGGLEQIWRGGNFWDGRATGVGGILNTPIEEQALGPFVSAAEGAFPHLACVVHRVQNASYYRTYFGRSTLNFGGFKTEWCANPDAASSRDAIESWLRNGNRHAGIANAWYNIARAIGAYEASPRVNRFSSNWDQGRLTTAELRGQNIFMGKGQCAACHLGEGIALERGAEVFSDHSYYNLGLPPNRAAPNAQGPDLGLGAFLASVWNEGWFREKYADVLGVANAQPQRWNGAFKTATIRNVAKAPKSTTTVRTFMHNGVLTSLEQVVDFYNTRDVRTCRRNQRPEVDRKTGLWTCWETPEVNNFNNVIGRDIDLGLVGNLRLTSQEQKDLVAFLKTVTDR
jgi:cytochrome c peroxidase